MNVKKGPCRAPPMFQPLTQAQTAFGVIPMRPTRFSITTSVLTPGIASFLNHPAGQRAVLAAPSTQRVAFGPFTTALASIFSDSTTSAATTTTRPPPQARRLQAQAQSFGTQPPTRSKFGTATANKFSRSHPQRQTPIRAVMRGRGAASRRVLVQRQARRPQTEPSGGLRTSTTTAACVLTSY